MRLEVTVLHGSRRIVDVDDEPIAPPGRQGAVFNVRAIDGQSIQNELLKVCDRPFPGWTSQQIREHIRIFTEHIQRSTVRLSGRPRTGPLWDMHRGLVALPRFMCDLADERFGFFMTRVPGSTVEMQDSDYDRAMGQGLASRLCIGRDLAECVDILHKAGIVHCDIADDNIIVDASSNLTSIYVIDVDGGAILDQQGRPIRGASALVDGKEQSFYKAPELKFRTINHPNFDSDNWSLGILLHKLLVGYGLQPFDSMGWGGPADIRNPYTWPPQPAHLPADIKEQAEYQNNELCRRLGFLLDRFRATFCFEFGAWRPTMRTKAETWAQELDKALRWVFVCRNSGCAEQFVAVKRTQCPFCGTPIHHTILRVPGNVSTLVDDQWLNKSDIGFDRHDTSPIIYIERQDETHLKINVHDVELRESGGTRYGPGEFVIAQGRHRFSVRSGRQWVEMQLEVL